MFVRLACYGVHIRPPRVHVPAFPDSSLPGVHSITASRMNTYKPPAADALQCPLCSRFRQRLTPSVRPLSSRTHEHMR